MTRRTTVAAVASFLLVLAACGDDDDTGASIETPAGDVDVSDIDAGDIDVDALQDAESMDDVLDATGLETKTRALQAGMGFEDYELIDDKTVKIFIEEDLGTGGISECGIANAIVDEDETVIIVIGDEEINCREQ